MMERSSLTIVWLARERKVTLQAGQTETSLCSSPRSSVIVSHSQTGDR